MKLTFVDVQDSDEDNDEDNDKEESQETHF